MLLNYVFIFCAVLGGTIMVCQMILTLIGMAGDSLHLDLPHDSGHGLGGDWHGDAGGGFHGGDSHGGDSPAVAHGHHSDDSHGSTSFFKMLSFRTLVAAFAFFGIAGLGAQSAGADTVITLTVALAAGTAAMYGVFWMMQGLARLRSEGTVRVQRAVGKRGTVYLRIPAERGGMGKVHLNLQNRTMEYEAVTSGPSLPTGAKVVVVDVVSPAVLEVQAAPETEHAQPTERNSHV